MGDIVFVEDDSPSEAQLILHMIEEHDCNEQQFLRGADPVLMHKALNQFGICEERYYWR